MDGAALKDPPARPARRWRARPLWLAGLAALAAILSSTSASGPAPSGRRATAASGAVSVTAASDGGAAPTASGGDATSSCPAPAKPPRYPDVAPIFERHCAQCHDSSQSDNAAAQAVFEMTSYPFSTRRPATLLADLRAMLPRRGALSADEKCRGLQWLTAGALDAAGNPPRWR